MGAFTTRRRSRQALPYAVSFIGWPRRVKAGSLIMNVVSSERPTQSWITVSSERSERLVASIFLIPFFLVRIAIAVRGSYESSSSISLRLSIVEPLVLIVAVIAVAKRSELVQGRALGISLVLIALNALAVFSRPPLPSALAGGIYSAGAFRILAIVSTGLVAFAVRPRVLFEMFVRFSVVICAVSIPFWVLARAGVAQYLVNSNYSPPRLQMFFSEPSALAPMVAAVSIARLRRHQVSNRQFAVVVLAGLLAFSPTVYLTTATSVLLVWMWRRARWRALKMAGALALAILVSTAGALEDLDRLGTGLFRSGNPLTRSVGRLVIGVAEVRSGNAYSNSRLVNSNEIIDDVVWKAPFGYGLDASGPFYRSRYPEQGAAAGRENSLFFGLFFSFGLPGALLFVFMALRVLRRSTMDRDFEYLMPFVVAATINSAGGYQLYKFVIFGFLCSAREEGHKQRWT
jgi:hypothetical protein